MADVQAVENDQPSLLPLVLGVTVAMVVASVLFLVLGMTVVGWKVCCDLGMSEFTDRDAAVEAVVDGMGPVWPFQSIELDTNNAGDILVQRNWLGVSELQAIIFNADHERIVAEGNDLEPAFAAGTEWVFHNDYERGAGVTAKSALVGVGVIGLIFGVLGLMRRRRLRDGAF
jgi:hypothetical protein